MLTLENGWRADDLKETKERLSSEIEGLHKMLARKERNQEEALGRARVAEAGLAELQATHKIESTASKARIKELEQGYVQADEVSWSGRCGGRKRRKMLMAGCCGCRHETRPRASTRRWPRECGPCQVRLAPSAAPAPRCLCTDCLAITYCLQRDSEPTWLGSNPTFKNPKPNSQPNTQLVGPDPLRFCPRPPVLTNQCLPLPAVSSVQAAQSGDASTSASLQRLEQAQREFNASFGAALEGAARDARLAAGQSEAAEGEAREVRGEYARFRRTIEEFEREREGGGG